MNNKSLTKDKLEPIYELVPYEKDNLDYELGYRESDVLEAIKILKRNLYHSIDGLFLKIAYSHIDRAFPNCEKETNHYVKTCLK